MKPKQVESYRIIKDLVSFHVDNLLLLIIIGTPTEIATIKTKQLKFLMMIRFRIKIFAGTFKHAFITFKGHILILKRIVSKR